MAALQLIEASWGKATKGAAVVRPYLDLKIHKSDAEEDGGDAGPLKRCDAFFQENGGEGDGGGFIPFA
jgi:hypothetical protein